MDKLQILLLAIVAYIVATMVLKRSAYENGEYKVYGTNSCGWTTRQLKYLKDKKITHKYINCENDRASCKGVNGFPTIEHPDGKQTVGYMEI